MFSFLTAPKLLITALIASVFTVAVIQSNVNQANLVNISANFGGQFMSCAQAISVASKKAPQLHDPCIKECISQKCANAGGFVDSTTLSNPTSFGIVAACQMQCGGRSAGLGAGGEFGSACGAECAGKTGPALQVCLGNCQRGVFCESRFGGGGSLGGYGSYGPEVEYGANAGETGFPGGGDYKTRELCIMHCMESTTWSRERCDTRCSFGEEFMSCEEEVCNEVYNPNLEEEEQMEHIYDRIQDICYRDSGAEADSGGENFDSGGDLSEDGTFGVDNDEDGSGEMGDDEGGSCGDEVCDGKEDSFSCPEDCGPPPDECGDDICGFNEDDDTCPQDCRGAADECGNSVCDSDEDEFSCPEDCPSDGGLGDQNTDFENVDQGDEWGDGAEADTGEVGFEESTGGGESIGDTGDGRNKCEEVTQSSSCCEKCEYLSCKGKMTFETCIVQHCGGIQDDCSRADQSDDTGDGSGNEEPFCGDGTCNEDIGEDQDFCPEDCGFGDDDFGTDGEGVCGDDVCDLPNENIRTCYEDCAESYQACVNRAGQYPPDEEDPATYYCASCLQDFCSDRDPADAVVECQQRGMCTGSSGGGGVGQGNQCGDLTSGSTCEETCHFIACMEGTDIQQCLDENCEGGTDEGNPFEENADICNYNQQCELQEMGTACPDCADSHGSCNYNQECEVGERGTDCTDCAGLEEDACNYDQTCDPEEVGTACFDCFLDEGICNFDDICDPEEVGAACTDCATSNDDGDDGTLFGDVFGDVWGDDAGDVCNYDQTCDPEEVGTACFDCFQDDGVVCNNDQICDELEIGTSCWDCFGGETIVGTNGGVAGDAGDFWGAGGTEGEFDLVPPGQAPHQSAGVQAVSEAFGSVFVNIKNGLSNFFRGLFGG